LLEQEKRRQSSGSNHKKNGRAGLKSLKEEWRNYGKKIEGSVYGRTSLAWSNMLSFVVSNLLITDLNGLKRERETVI